MRMTRLSRRLAAFAACACLLAGCSRGRSDSAGPAQIDTANTEWEDGMSAEQVQTEAQAMSPEQAAQAGLSVDTTIHLEQLDPRDTLPGGTAPTPPPAAGGTGATDTAGAAARP